MFFFYPKLFNQLTCLQVFMRVSAPLKMHKSIRVKSFFNVSLLAVFGFFVQNHNMLATKYYVSSTTGNNSNSAVQAQNPATPWQTLGFAVSQAVSDDSIVVQAGNYNEVNLTINKRLKIFGNETAGVPGVGARPVFEASAAPSLSSYFIVTSTDVTIQNFELRVNQITVMRGIFSPGSGFNRLRILDNHIFSSSSSGLYEFNSFGILLGQAASSATLDSFLIARNIIRPLAFGNSLFGRGIRTFGGFGKIGGANPADSNQIWGIFGIQSGNSFARLQILNNHILGSSAALEINIPAANQTHLVSGNVFEPLQGLESLCMLEIKNNTRTNSIIRVQNNRFNRFMYNGVFSTRSRNVEVLNNTFNPVDTGRSYTCIAANTKQQSTANDAPVSNSIVIKGNVMNGSAFPGGTGISFQNHNFGTGVVPFVNVEVGGAGTDANTFGSNIRTFVALDSASGTSRRIPVWNQTGYPATQMRPVDIDLNLGQNQFNLGLGPKLPSALTETELLLLENKLNHGIDFDSLGFLSVLPNAAFVTTSSFLFPKSTSPSVQRAVNQAADGWIITAEPGTYSENVTIDKFLTLENFSNGTVTLQGLTMNGSGKIFSIEDPVVVTNNFNLTDGIVSLSASNLRIASSAANTGGSQQSYVRTNGTGQLIFSGLQAAKTYHIGTSTTYFPTTLANSGTADDIGLRVLNNVFEGGTTGTPVDSAVGVTWVANEGTPGGSNLTLTANWPGSSEKPFFNRTAVVLQAFGSAWTTISGPAPISATGTDPYQAVFSNINASLSNTPLRIFNFQIPPVPDLLYVDDATGNDTRTRDDAQNPATPWKTITKALSSVVDGDSIQVFSGTYNEANLAINKKVKIFGSVVGIGTGPGAGTGIKPIVSGSSLSPNGNIFSVQAADVLIRNFEIRVDQANVVNGIIAPGPGFNGLRIEDNLILSTGSAGPSVFGTYGIQLGQISALAGLDSFLVLRNTVRPLAPANSLFGRALRLAGGFGRVGSALAADSNFLMGDYGIQAGAQRSTLQVINNSLFGRTSAFEITIPAANRTHRIAGNKLRPVPGFNALSLLEIKSNLRDNSQLIVEGNQFTGHPFYGVFSTRSRNVTVRNNVFSPVDTARNFYHIVVNTKQQTTGTDTAASSSIAVFGNTFNGSSALSGNGIVFQNYHSGAIPPFTNIQIGGAGALANSFGANIQNFVALDSASGASTRLPLWSQAGYPATVMLPADVDIDLSQNTFNVGTGSKLPAAMATPELLNLEDRLVHAIDFDSLGFLTVVPNEAYVTNNSFISPKTTAPSLIRAVKPAADGWEIFIQPAQINETVEVTKDLTWNTFPLDTMRLGGINMNGLSKTLTLSDRIILLNNLTLNNINGGKIAIGAGDLVVLPGTNVTTGSTESYVITSGTGGLIRRGVDDQPKLFPVGTIDSYAPVTFDDGNNTGDNFKVNVRPANTNADFTPPLPASINTFVKFQYNICEDVIGGSNAQLNFNWIDPINVNGPGTINGIARFDGTNWNSVLALIGPGLEARALFTDFCSPFAVVGDPALTNITTQNVIKIGPGVTGRFCLGDSIKIPFTVIGTGIVAGNTFNAFLSLPDGTFPPAGGVLLGSKNGQVSDTIRGLLPVGTVPGNRYRVRVVSTNFPITGQAAPDSLSIFGLPARPVITGDSVKCEGTPVTLTSSTATGFFWIPGGQTTPSINVSANAAIRVRISDVNGCTNASAVRNVNFNPRPTADPITANGPLVRCQGDTVILTANPAGLTYSWLNLAPPVNTRNLTVTTGGSYSAIVTNAGGCSDTSAAVSVTFNPLPAKPLVTSPNPNICEPGPLTFQTAAGFTYLWNNTGITPSPTGQNVDITTVGTYNVTVTITDANNCRNTSDPFNGTLRKAPALPAISTQGNDVSVCEGNTIVLVPVPFTASNTYTWNPGGTVGSSFSYSTVGSQSFTVTVDSNGCSRTSTVPLLVNINPRPATPVATISSGSSSFCDGSSAVLSSSPAFSYLWTPGGGTAQNLTVTTSGTYSVVAVSDSGCQSSASNSIAITSRPNPAKPQITASRTSFCDGQSATLSVSNPFTGNTYTWSNGLTGSPITISAGGTYFVRSDSSNNCFSNSDLLDIIQNPLPVPVITAVPGDFQACRGDSVVLSSNFSSGNSWNTSPVNTNTQVAFLNSASGIVLTVTDANGCVNSTIPVNVVIDPLPVVKLEKDTALIFGDQFNLQATNFSSNFQNFTWLVEDLPLATTTIPIFEIKPTQTNTYSVVITDQNGCRATDSVRVRVARELYIPNMFSPNKDGKNDVFKVYGFGVASIEVKIWDRLGNLVYETNRVDDIVEESESGNSVPGWDGKFKGKELGQDTYIWNVKGKLVTGQEIKVNGGKNSGPVIIMN